MEKVDVVVGAGVVGLAIAEMVGEMVDEYL